MTKILIVNPNTTASMTDTIGAAARVVAAPGSEIVAITSAMGPVSIEGYYDEAFAVPGLIQALRDTPDADAAIVACFDDTGLDAARTAAPFPVVGICEAALVTAGQIAKRIAVDAMALQLRQDAVVTEAGSAAVHQRLGKARLRQQLRGFQRVEQGVDIVAFLRMALELARQLQPAVLTSG